MQVIHSGPFLRNIKSQLCDLWSTWQKLLDRKLSDMDGLPEDAKCNQNISRGKQIDSLFLNDGNRLIDYVLVNKLPSNDPSINEQMLAMMRHNFEASIQDSGLVLEEEIDIRKKIRFLKIHAPWIVLKTYAEISKLRKPIAVNTMTQGTKPWLQCLQYDKNALPDETPYFTTHFTNDREHCFIKDDLETFFNTAERSRMTLMILNNTSIEDESEIYGSYLGFRNLLAMKCYIADFPIHTGSAKCRRHGPSSNVTNLRHLLHANWSSWRCVFKFQPLDHINQYFGSRIGFYFLFLGFYTQMLVPIALLGVMVFLYGLCTSDEVSQEICSRTGNDSITMCPACDRVCSYWKLHQSCMFARMKSTLDNNMTVVFAMFMVFWAVLMLGIWKRREAEYRFRWHIQDSHAAEVVRPEYLSLCLKGKGIKVVGDDTEPIVTTSFKCLHICASISTIIFMLCTTMITVFAVIIYKVTVIYALPYTSSVVFEENFYSYLLINGSAAAINLVGIIILGHFYRKIASFLTDYEVPRTESEWQNSFILKLFLFEFVNTYTSLFYIAFIKGIFKGRPGKYNLRVLQGGYRLEECPNGGCYIQLCVHLAVIMFGKQTYGTVVEMLLPLMYKWWYWRQSGTLKEHLRTTRAPRSRLVQDFSLPPLPVDGLADEHLELVIQFGFVTMFASAFPLAAIFALLNNVVEIRLDARKFTMNWRRPIATTDRGLVPWYNIFRTLAKLAVVTNAMVIAFTSEFIKRQVYLHSNNASSLDGYVNFTLSTFDVSDFESQSIPLITDFPVKECHYEDFRQPPSSPTPYQPTMFYYQVHWARCLFIIAFVAGMTMLSWVIEFMIPHTPTFVKVQQLREDYLSRTLIADNISSSLVSSKESMPESHKDTLVDTKTETTIESSRKPVLSSQPTVSSSYMTSQTLPFNYIDIPINPGDISYVSQDSSRQ